MIVWGIIWGMSGTYRQQWTTICGNTCTSRIATCMMQSLKPTQICSIKHQRRRGLQKYAQLPRHVSIFMFCRHCRKSETDHLILGFLTFQEGLSIGSLSDQQMVWTLISYEQLFDSWPWCLFNQAEVQGCRVFYKSLSEHWTLNISKAEAGNFQS